MEEIISKIAEHAPAVAILIWIYIDKRKEVRDLRTENKELNLVIREQQKEGIEAMGEVNQVLKELTTIVKYGKGKEKT